MIPPHMIPAFLLIGCCIIMMSSLSAAVSVSTNKDVQKALEEWQNEQNEQNEQNNDPSSSPTPSPSQPRFRYPIGTTVKCEENDPYGENEKHRYRVSSNQGKLRHYPGDDIAKSWDEENWEYEEYIEDCAGLALGDPMPSRPTVGKSAKCGKNDLKNKNNNAVYRVNEDGTFGHYPNPTIAASWDSDWADNTTIGDCEGIILGGDLQINPDATNTSSSPSAIEYHCVLDTAKKDGFPGDWDFFLNSFKTTCATNLGENHSKETCLNVKHGHYPDRGESVIIKYCKWVPKTN